MELFWPPTYPAKDPFPGRCLKFTPGLYLHYCLETFTNPERFDVAAFDLVFRYHDSEAFCKFGICRCSLGKSSLNTFELEIMGTGMVGHSPAKSTSHSPDRDSNIETRKSIFTAHRSP